MEKMYEFSITGALAFTGAYLFALKKYKLRWLGLPVSISVLLTLGTAIHNLVSTNGAIGSSVKINMACNSRIGCNYFRGVFLLANCIAATYLILDKYEKTSGRPDWAKRLPSLEVLDNLSYRLVALVFPLLDICSDCWCNLGRVCLGQILGLGSKRDLGIYHLGCIRCLSTCTSDCWLAWA
jgi:hypothetical protein